MDSERTLIEGETDACKDTGVVSLYSQRMRENEGTILLKNQVEMDLCTTYAVGPKVLDVGVGTGRASLALAALGFEVTGVDGSQAMLDECRRMAAELPIALKLGDVAALPFHNEQYHTLMALNVMAQFPHWQTVLAEWKRVVVPGGRIIFDIHSLDHVLAACGESKAEILSRSTAQDGDSFIMRVSVSDVVEQANRLGLTIKEIIPYGAFFGGENTNYWLYDSLESSFWWNRFMSLLSVDERLFQFVLFLEEQCVSSLSCTMTGRMMVILENRADNSANENWLKRNQHLNEALLGNFSSSAVVPYLPQPFDAWRNTLNEHLDYSRNSVFFYHLWSKLFPKIGRLDLESLLAPRHIKAMQRWRDQDNQDQTTLQFAQEWYCQPRINELLEYKGVSLGSGMEYLLMQDLLSAAGHMPDKIK